MQNGPADQADLADFIARGNKPDLVALQLYYATQASGCLAAAILLLTTAWSCYSIFGELPATSSWPWSLCAPGTTWRKALSTATQFAPLCPTMLEVSR